MTIGGNWPPFESEQIAEVHALRPQGPIAVTQFVLEQFGAVVNQSTARYQLADGGVVLLVDSWAQALALKDQPRQRERGRVPLGVGWEGIRQPIAWMVVGGPIESPISE